MSKDINVQKEQAFNSIRDILMSIEAEDVDDFEKTIHILDVLEQLLARTIAGSSLNNDHVEEISQESFANIKRMAMEFLKDEMEEVAAN